MNKAGIWVHTPKTNKATYQFLKFKKATVFPHIRRATYGLKWIVTCDRTISDYRLEIKLLEQPRHATGALFEFDTGNGGLTSRAPGVLQSNL